MALGPAASFRTYVVLSLLLSTAVVSHAAFQKRFFYRTMVYLSDSKVAIMAAGNLALVSVILVWKAVQAVFLGRLRFREIERLNVRARDAIIECCFATTIFRDEVNLTFLALVTTLLMMKSLHWLAKDRMDFLEEQPLSPRVAHVRLLGLMSLLFLTDAYMVAECAKATFRMRRVGTMLVLFAFEFTVLLIELCSNFVRYVFHAIDLRMDGRWEGKGLYVFYNELVTDLCQLTVYLAFFLYVHVYYTFPLHILREVYLTFSKFQRRCMDFIRYRRVMSTMNERFPDATEEELAAGDRTCIICREEMPAAKKLPCGHMFHAHCLQSWLRRQLSCPTCRSPVDVATPVQNGQAQPNGQAQGAPDAAHAGGAGENAAAQPARAQENTGFVANARRLWRHIAYGEPRDGAPAAPAPAPAPARAAAAPPEAPAAPIMNINERIAAARALLPAALRQNGGQRAEPRRQPQPPPLGPRPTQAVLPPNPAFAPHHAAQPAAQPVAGIPGLAGLPGNGHEFVPVPQPGGGVVHMRFPAMYPMPEAFAPGHPGAQHVHIMTGTGGFPGHTVLPPSLGEANASSGSTMQGLLAVQEEIDQIHGQVSALRARIGDLVGEAAVEEAVRASAADAVTSPAIVRGSAPHRRTEEAGSLATLSSRGEGSSASVPSSAEVPVSALSREQEEVRQRRLRFLAGGRNGQAGAPAGAGSGNANESG